MDKVNKISGLPDPFASFTEKLSTEYGVKIGKQISADWFGGNGFATGNCAFIERREYVRKKRLFVRGEYDILNIKQDYSPRAGALDLVNLNFTQINWAEKFNRVVSGGISDDNFTLDIRATDKFSTIQKQNKRDYYAKYMAAKPMLEKSKQLNGINLMPKGHLPEDEQELNLQMEINERPKIEIAEEILIKYVLSTNDWDFLKGQYNKDLVDVGLIVARVYLDKNDGVKLAYVDPENYIHSKVTRSDFKDKYYEGVVDTITISDLRRESGFDDEILKKVARLHNTDKRNDWNTCGIDDIIDYRVDVLRFAYKTSKTINYKKRSRKGQTIKLSRRPDTWEGSESNKVSKTLDTWVEGNYILGSEYVYGYKECENLFDDVMNKAMSPFITFAHKIYENRLQCFTTNIEVPAMELQRISIKLQQLVKELKPDGIIVDMNQLAELDDGKGGTNQQAWERALNLWEVKGIVFTKRTNMGEDGVKDNPAVQPLAYQQGTAFIPLLNAWAHYYNLIRENTGVNPARDGSLPSDALVGVAKLAELSSNTVTKDIVDTAILFKKRICETISSRLKSIYTYKEASHLKEIYTNVLGKQFLDAMDVLKNRHLHEFGFTYEMVPTQQEVQEFREDLAMAIQEGYIDAYVRSEAVRLARVNMKLATEYVRMHIKQSKKQKLKEQMMLSKDKSQNDAAAAQAKTQSEVQSFSIKTQIELEAEAKKAQIEIMKVKAIKEIEAPYDEREFQEDVYLQKIKSYGEFESKKYMEDRKDERTGIQATQQSKLKKQAQTDGPPIDFKNENSWFEPQL